MQIPKGYKLVPVEPTHEMIAALKGRITTTSRGGLLACGLALADAIEAAPTPPQPIYDEPKERELFEVEFPVPEFIIWNHQNNRYERSAFGVTAEERNVYRAMWLGWQKSAQSRAKSMEVGDE